MSIDKFIKLVPKEKMFLAGLLGSLNTTHSLCVNSVVNWIDNKTNAAAAATQGVYQMFYLVVSICSTLKHSRWFMKSKWND